MFNLENNALNLSPVKMNVIEYENNNSSAYSSNTARRSSFCRSSLHRVFVWANSVSMRPLKTENSANGLHNVLLGSTVQAKIQEQFIPFGT